MCFAGAVVLGILGGLPSSWNVLVARASACKKRREARARGVRWALTRSYMLSVSTFRQYFRVRA